jgi:cell division protein FtsX
MEAVISTNNINNYSISELNYIRETIEKMNKFNQIEILRILSKHETVTLNENKYGIHINLTDLDNSMIDELETYINYVNTQELNLNELEKQKEDFKNIYFTKDNKDNHAKNSKNANITS